MDEPNQFLATITSAKELAIKLKPLGFHLAKETDAHTYWCFTLRHQTMPEAGLHVNINDSSKYVISGSWPTASGFGTFCPNSCKSINVKRDKTSDIMCREIQRRLLTWYYPELENQVKLKEGYLQRQATKTSTLDDIVKMLECTGPQSGYDTFRPYRYGINECQVSGDGKKVRFATESLPVDTVKQIIELMKTLVPKR